MAEATKNMKMKAKYDSSHVPAAAPTITTRVPVWNFFGCKMSTLQTICNQFWQWEALPIIPIPNRLLSWAQIKYSNTGNKTIWNFLAAFHSGKVSISPSQAIYHLFFTFNTNILDPIEKKPHKRETTELS